jgi:hypothetical protein
LRLSAPAAAVEEVAQVVARQDVRAGRAAQALDAVEGVARGVAAEDVGLGEDDR